ncbi:phosphatidate cytidylyltransferase [Microbacterium sp. NIBRBAC000506063]|uniref:phosphatidate cytidylyltransferase n=1 Tax=Microbacterium sp. NIBRBAC000506063 TaxID=2734618 RepID=UPI00397F39CC
MTDPHDGDSDAGEHPDLREHWRSKREELRGDFEELRGEFGQHVSHARDQLEEANERIKERTGRDLIVAILIGVGLGAVVVSSLVFVKWLFLPIALAIVLLGTYELCRALRAGGRHIDTVPQIIAAVLLVLTAYFAELWLFWVALFAAVVLVIVWRMLAQMLAADGRTYGDVLSDVLSSALIQIYVPFLASMAVLLLKEDGGEWWLLGFVVVVVAADTGAYASGLMFGKHPMAPRISPKKTWEGFAGALVVSGVAATLIAVFMLGLPWWAGPIFGVVILLTATLGDLAESMLKRDLGIKDMSSWLPGHGGVLDRLDSILPSAAAALCLYHLLPLWTGA